MTHLGQHNGQAAGDPERLQRDIARQREALADTVDALSRRLDVKHRAEEAVQERASHLREAVTTDEGKPRPDLLAAGAAVVAGVALLLWWRAHS
jgi:hypothetical protein